MQVFKGCVIDGRDIGNKVFKNAKIKLFIKVKPEIRAKRRHKQLIEQGEKSIYSRILKDINLRDKNDKKDLDYEIIYNQTANLIKNSSLVVGHNSTAVSLVVLFKKPYTCITTDELMKNPYFYFSLKKLKTAFIQGPISL